MQHSLKLLIKCILLKCWNTNLWMQSRVGDPCFYLSKTSLTTRTVYIYHDIEICQVLWPSDQFLIGPPPTPPPFRKVGGPSFLDSSPCFLNSSKTDWASNLELLAFWRYFRRKYGQLPKYGVGAPRRSHRGPKGPKMAKIMNLLDFATIQFTQVKYFGYNHSDKKNGRPLK